MLAHRFSATINTHPSTLSFFGQHNGKCAVSTCSAPGATRHLLVTPKRRGSPKACHFDSSRRSCTQTEPLRLAQSIGSTGKIDFAGIGQPSSLHVTSGRKAENYF